MKTSIATVSLSGNFPEKLAAIAHAGFYGIEIFENDFLAYDHSPQDVGKMVRDHGLVVTVFQPFRDFEGLPEPLRTRAFDRAERKFDVMQQLGTDLMLVCSSVSPQAIGGIERAAGDFFELGDRAAKRGLKVGFEALAWGRFIYDHRDAWEIVRRANHPSIGLILDSFHTLSRGIEVDSIRSIPGEKIFLVQLADAPKLELDYLSWSRHFRNMPGQGDLPVYEFMQAVEATRYSGVVSLEIFNDQFRAGSPRVVAVDGKRSLIYLEDRLSAEPASPAPSARAHPARAKCQGFEFIEFALDDANAADFENVLASLGFQKFGEHKTKDVTVWSQGQIKFVINRERDSFAHSFYNVHGPAVCAFGLQVDNARETEERARHLLAMPFRQALAEDQLEIPAIRGVGNSLIYFIDKKTELARVWELEFNLCDMQKAHHPAGLTQIDHISQVTEYDEMLSWLLFYTSIFDVTKLPPLDIADPAGLVRSQVVQSPDGSLRIALNGAQSLRTLSGRFLYEFFGSGTQHIALSTDDIFAAAKALKANGLATLAIPENYYDDLIARFQLDEELIKELSAYGILYDRDQAGEYFQIYTRTFADRFFFEIVQRGNYGGFGAFNAPIRLAAQTRLAGHPGVPKH